MVGEPPLTMEWEDSGKGKALDNHRDICFQLWWGSNFLGRSDMTSVVQAAHQPFGKGVMALVSAEIDNSHSRTSTTGCRTQ